MVHHILERITTFSLCTASSLLAYYTLTKSGADANFTTSPLLPTIMEEVHPLLATAIGLVGGIATMKLYHVALVLPSMISIFWGTEYATRYFHQVKHEQDSYTYKIHQTHHRPRSKKQWFEANDWLSLKNTIILSGPFLWSAQATPMTCGTATLFGICSGFFCYALSFTIIHSGVHHRRFPVWGLDRIPFIQRIADAHKHHHTSQQGAPFGLFLGPEEVEAEQAGVPPSPMPLFLKVVALLFFSFAVFGVPLGY